jgi:hypothetical protein
MKRNKLFDAALALAKTTQEFYLTIGAAGTQNVRNPLPMRELVPCVLPTLRSTKSAAKNGMTTVEVFDALVQCGFVVKRTTVIKTLSILSRHALVCAVAEQAAPSKIRSRGRPPFRYFLRHQH